MPRCLELLANCGHLLLRNTFSQLTGPVSCFPDYHLQNATGGQGAWASLGVVRQLCAEVQAGTHS